MQSPVQSQYPEAGENTAGAWDALPDPAAVQKTVEALRARGFRAEAVPDAAAALERVAALIPEGAELMTGSSKTLDEIGLTATLKAGAHRWSNLKERILAEKDPEKQALLRRQAVFADYFVGSVQAITEGGELVVGSATGSQVAAYAYGGRNLILVAGTQKITRDIDGALRRLRERSTPLEDQRMKALGYPGTVLSKVFIYEEEPRRNVHVILVNQKLGF